MSSWCAYTHIRWRCSRCVYIAIWRWSMIVTHPCRTHSYRNQPSCSRSERRAHTHTLTAAATSALLSRTQWTTRYNDGVGGRASAGLQSLPPGYGKARRPHAPSHISPLRPSQSHAYTYALPVANAITVLSEPYIAWTSLCMLTRTASRRCRPPAGSRTRAAHRPTQCSDLHYRPSPAR